MFMTNYFEINDDHLCEAVGCFERPTIEIKLKVDQRQTIILHVCAKCVNKFDQKEKVLESVDQPFSNTNYSTPPVSVQGVRSRQ
jgi:hypothetical protein